MHPDVLLPTLHYCHQASADSRHHIPQEPLFNFVHPQPADNRQKREPHVLGLLRVPALRQEKTKNLAESVTSKHFFSDVIAVILMKVGDELQSQPLLTSDIHARGPMWFSAADKFSHIVQQSCPQSKQVCELCIVSGNSSPSSS